MCHRAKPLPERQCAFDVVCARDSLLLQERDKARAQPSAPHSGSDPEQVYAVVVDSAEDWKAVVGSSSRAAEHEARVLGRDVLVHLLRLRHAQTVQIALDEGLQDAALIVYETPVASSVLLPVLRQLLLDNEEPLQRAVVKSVLGEVKQPHVAFDIEHLSTLAQPAASSSLFFLQFALTFEFLRPSASSLGMTCNSPRHRARNNVQCTPSSENATKKSQTICACLHKNIG